MGAAEKTTNLGGAVVVTSESAKVLGLPLVASADVSVDVTEDRWATLGEIWRRMGTVTCTHENNTACTTSECRCPSIDDAPVTITLKRAA